MPAFLYVSRIIQSHRVKLGQSVNIISGQVSLFFSGRPQKGIVISSRVAVRRICIFEVSFAPGHKLLQLARIVSREAVGDFDDVR